MYQVLLLPGVLPGGSNESAGKSHWQIHQRIAEELNILT
jgi:hypothetical protein